MLLDLIERKRTGSYYTSREVADFLAAVAIRRPADRILEPCFGEGVFLKACHDRARSMSPSIGDGAIVGIDMNDDLVQEGLSRFPYAELVAADFFEVDPNRLGRFDAVVGNPPFVRYHRFNGKQRERALLRAAEADVNLSALTSAWVPFLVHATRHLQPGGRLCVVAPFEITYARYARPFVSYLCDRFANVRVLLFNQPLFPELNEATVLLVADDWGGQTSSMELVHAETVRDLDPERIFTADAEAVPADDWDADAGRTSLYRLDPKARDLYLAIEERVPRLGDLADVTIGYVTGDNTWFHMSQPDVRNLGLNRDVQLVLRRSADLKGRGLALDPEAHHQLAEEGAHWLFTPNEPLTAVAEDRIRSGERALVQTAYKCRVRTPWWRVPSVRPHDFVLGVFSTLGPRLVATDLPATNSLLVGDLKQPVSATTLAAAALTSFAALAAEVNGHALGGGALKLEPAEARRWSLPMHEAIPGHAVEEIHQLLASGHTAKASTLADQVFLRDALQLDANEIRVLQQALWTLRQARLKHRAD